MPSEFAIGCCIEVWSDDEPRPWSDPKMWGPISAWRNYAQAFRGWVESLRSAAAQSRPRKPAKHPYSVTFLIDDGRTTYAEELLAKGGATLQDLEALRAAARRRVLKTRSERLLP
ncbi:MAG: hypothetical protein ABIO14_09305 [Aeromicrobium sp.]